MPKTIIFANGPSQDPEENRYLIHPGDTIICANGGTRYAEQLGITPDLIIGDLDSIDGETITRMERRGVEVQRHSAKKDQTDLELALAAAIEMGASEILILTATGGRLDQFLANLLLLARSEWKAARLSLAAGNQRAWVLRGPDEIQLDGTRGDTLSLIPLSPQVTGVDLTGFEWPAENISFDFGSTRPISNTFTHTNPIIRIESGIALIIHISQ